MEPKWENFWYIYEMITGMKPKHRKNFEEEYKKAKKELTELFGGTKIEIEKEAEMSYDEIAEEIKNYLDGLWERAQKREVIPNEVLPDIHHTMLMFLQFYTLQADLITGYITQSSPILEITNNTVTPGMKVAKALKIVLKEKGFEQYTNFLVQDLSILQGKLKNVNKKVKITVSLDPLDFLLASNATTGWKTCHSLDGEHAAGNLSYLMDRHTAIAYAYREYTRYIGVEVPKKIWRQWVFIDIENAVALFQRQYPTDTEAFSKEVRSIVGKALKEYHNIEEKEKWRFGKWHSDRDERYYFNKAELAFPDPTDKYIYFKNFSPERDDWWMQVGERVVCPICGGNLDIGSKLYCSSCAGYVRCYECSRWVSEDEAYIGPDDNYYCEYCFSKLFATCEYCGEKVLKEEILLTPSDEYVCPACYKEYCETCSMCRTPVWKEDAVWVDNEPYCEMCFNKKFTVCSNCGEPVKKEETYMDEAHYTDNQILCEICYQEIRREAAV